MLLRAQARTTSGLRATTTDRCGYRAAGWTGTTITGAAITDMTGTIIMLAATGITGIGTIGIGTTETETAETGVMAIADADGAMTTAMAGGATN